MASNNAAEVERTRGIKKLPQSIVGYNCVTDNGVAMV
jgi:hypothetical protein